MIHRLSANQSSFRTVNFKQGLNVIIAVRAETSTAKDTRNGLGKSTLIEIIDFCLGSRATKGNGLNIEPLEKWAFTLEVTLRQRHVSVTRAIAAPNRVVVEGVTDGWPEQPKLDSETGELVFKVDSWRTLLGWALFDLPCAEKNLPYKPSYRSLVSYLVRRRPDAYTSPFRHFRQQKTWDIQLHIAYLLGMNWEYAARWQGLKDQEEGVKAIEKAITTGVMEGAFGTIGEMETQRIQLEGQVATDRQALDSFRVHPQYESVQIKADRLTQKLHKLANDNVVDRRRLARYLDSIRAEKSPNVGSLERLYEEAGVVFPQAVMRTLGEARAFHRDLLSNRKEFLQSEVGRIERAIEKREARITDLTEQRAELLQLLQTHGALQEMTQLQEHHIALQGDLDRVKGRLKEIKRVKTTKRDVKAAKAELVQTAEQDHDQRRDVWSSAVRLFNEHSQALYKSPGKLVIDIDDTGYKYSVDIERSGSEGVDKMKIFCFDLAVLQLQMEAKRGVDFLVHDTLMYDAVDPRQRALALERAHEVSEAIGSQYICTMNSDMVPAQDFSEGFDFDEHIRLTLTDTLPSGSLLGIRFQRPAK